MNSNRLKPKLPKLVKNKLLQKSGAVFFFRILGMALSYVAILYISNTYGADVYGRFSLSQTILQFSVVLFSLGLGTSVVKLTSDQNFFKNSKPLNRYLKNALILLFFSSVIGGGLLFILKDWMATTLFKDATLGSYFKYIGLFLLFVVLQEFFSEFLRGKSKFILYGIFKYVLPPLLFIAFLIWFHHMELEESSVLLAFVLAFVTIAAILVFLFPIRSMSSGPNYNFKSLLSISYPMMFSAAFLFLSNWTDIFMLGAMVSKSDVGVYNAAYKLAILALIVINAVNTVLAPKISELYSSNNLEGIKREVQSATRLITYTTVPIVAVLIMFRTPLLAFFGEEFVSGGNVLIIVSVGLLFNAMSGSVAQVLNMTQHQQTLKRITLVSVVVNIVFNYVLISRMGFVGAAVASLLSNVVLNLLCVIYIKREFGFFTFFIPWNAENRR